MDKAKMRILFVCTGNACRSQMAEGWARHRFGDGIEAFSAGVAPDGVDPRAVIVMKEAGVDISKARSKHVSEFDGQRFDLVVTVCDHAREVCPLIPGAALTYHRGFEDPPVLARSQSGERDILEAYRRVRDEIRYFVEGIPELYEKLSGTGENK